MEKEFRMKKQPPALEENTLGMGNKTDTTKLPIVKDIPELQTEIIKFMISDLQPLTRIESHNFQRLITSEWFEFSFN